MVIYFFSEISINSINKLSITKICLLYNKKFIKSIQGVLKILYISKAYMGSQIKNRDRNTNLNSFQVFRVKKIHGAVFV